MFYCFEGKALDTEVLNFKVLSNCVVFVESDRTYTFQCMFDFKETFLYYIAMKKRIFNIAFSAFW